MKNKLTDNNTYEELRDYVIFKEWSSSEVTARLASYRNRLVTTSNPTTQEKTKQVINWLERYNREFSKRPDMTFVKEKAIKLLEDGYSIIEVGEATGWKVTRTTLYKYKKGVTSCTSTK